MTLRFVDGPRADHGNALQLGQQAGQEFASGVLHPPLHRVRHDNDFPELPRAPQSARRRRCQGAELVATGPQSEREEPLHGFAVLRRDRVQREVALCCERSGRVQGIIPIEHEQRPRRGSKVAHGRHAPTELCLREIPQCLPEDRRCRRWHHQRCVQHGFLWSFWRLLGWDFFRHIRRRQAATNRGNRWGQRHNDGRHRVRKRCNPGEGKRGAR
mmetsp:Transcript_62770/g.181999  ORF Transcript_62770/g.181999 Transcript_62770/m.181999 type:complete len:214 (-) Transcript_62770:26-667(-)